MTSFHVGVRQQRPSRVLLFDVFSLHFAVLVIDLISDCKVTRGEINGIGAFYVSGLSLALAGSFSSCLMYHLHQGVI